MMKAGFLAGVCSFPLGAPFVMAKTVLQAQAGKDVCTATFVLCNDASHIYFHRRNLTTYLEYSVGYIKTRA